MASFYFVVSSQALGKSHNEEVKTLVGKKKKPVAHYGITDPLFGKNIALWKYAVYPMLNFALVRLKHAGRTLCAAPSVYF